MGGAKAWRAKIRFTAASGRKVHGLRSLATWLRPCWGAILNQDANAPLLLGECVVIAWPKRRWKTQCGRRRRDRKSCRYGNCWAARVLKSPAEFRLGFK